MEYGSEKIGLGQDCDTFLVQVQLGTGVVYTRSSTRLGFELMTSRS